MKRLFSVLIIFCTIFIINGSAGLAFDAADLFIIEDIQYQSLEDKAKLAIVMNAFAEHISYELKDPDIIIIDPLEEVYCDYEDKVNFDEGLIKSIEFIKTREAGDVLGEPYYVFDFLAIELREPALYKITQDGSNILLDIGETAEVVPTSEPEEESTGIELPPIEMEREPEEGPGDRKPKGKAVFRKDKNIVEQISEKIRKALSEEVKLSEIEEEPPSNIDLTKILTVDDCVNAAMDNYMPIKVAKEQIKLAKFKVNEAFRELFPVVSLLWTETSGKISQELYRGRKYGFEFKQPIFHGGELYFTWEQSKTNLKIAKENYNKVKEDLTHEVAKTYYELAKALNKLDIQKELFEKIKDDIERAKKEYELGLSTQLESLNAQSSYDQVFYSIAAAENDVSLKQLALAKSMHINVGTKINIDYKLKLKEFDINIDECLGLAMQNRSELKTKRLIVESTRIGERIAQSQLWPQLDLVGKYLKAAEQLEPRGLGMNLKNERFIGITAKAPLGSHTFEYQKKKGKLAPTVTTFASDTRYDTDVYKLTPFDDLGRYTSMKNAYVMRQQALSELKDVKQDLHSDVREAFYSFKEAQIKLNGSRNNLQLYEKEFLTMDLRKKLNEATTSEVMNAKIKFYTEKSVYTSAIGDIYLAIAGLNKAIGIGGYFK